MIVSFGTTVMMVTVARRVARRYGVTTIIRRYDGREDVVPITGGVAVMVGVVVAFSAAVAIAPVAPPTPVVVMAMLFGGIGLIDDLRPLSPWSRLAAEAAIALAMLSLAHPGMAPAALAAAVAWVVLIANSFNLADNMDGCAPAIGVAIAVCGGLAATSEGVPATAAVLAAASAAFLLFNRPPSSIILGDAGSLFLGSALAWVSLDIGELSVGGAATSMLLCGLLLVDTTVVVISRRRAGRSIFVGGTDHLSHRLVNMGAGPHAVVACLATASAVLGLGGVLSARGG
jgi:UDP-GlcNAc:undecaprenyl-phosphate/decaprenyl-phosphate GlcNAc-1-phosphate transferase